MTIKNYKIILLLAGITLLFFNILGFFIPLRAKGIYTEKTKFENDISLTYEDAKNEIERNDLDRTEYKKYI